MADALRTYRDAVAFVTGGASGIGAALARGLVARGATVVLADRQAELAEDTAARLRHGGGRAEAVALDVRDPLAVAGAVGAAADRHGRLDYLFNNAGTGVGGEVRDHTVDDWRYIVDVNLMGVVHGIHAAYPRFVAQGFGHIVNTASMAGLIATPFTVSYCATKHAVVGLSRALRLEAAPYGVRVSVLCPGVVRTPILDGAGRFGRVKRPVPPDVLMALWETWRPMDPDRFAARVLTKVARNPAVVIVPGTWRLILWFDRLAPRLAETLAGVAYRRTRASFEAAAPRGNAPLP
jgi:NAD(P)-dependent dehydrogenase (short-subunit alcohol dehydrogenase family)